MFLGRKSIVGDGLLILVLVERRSIGDVGHRSQFWIFGGLLDAVVLAEGLLARRQHIMIVIMQSISKPAPSTQDKDDMDRL